MGFRDLLKGALGIREPRRHTRDDDQDYRAGRSLGRSLPPEVIQIAQPFERDLARAARDADRGRAMLSQGIPLTRTTSLRANIAGPVINPTFTSGGIGFRDGGDRGDVDVTPRRVRAHTRTRSHGRTDTNTISYRPRSSHDTARVRSSTTWQDGDFSHLRATANAGRRNSFHVSGEDSYGGTDRLRTHVRHSEHRGIPTTGAAIATPTFNLGGSFSGHQPGDRSKYSFVDGRKAPRGHRYEFIEVRPSGRIREALVPK